MKAGCLNWWSPSPFRCGSQRSAALLSTPWATDCRRAAQSRRCSPSRYYRKSCSTTTARHRGTLSSCSRLGVARRPSFPPHRNTRITRRRTPAEGIKRSRQDRRSSCRWIVGAWWQISCPLPPFSRSSITMVTSRTNQVSLRFPLLPTLIILTSTRWEAAASPDTAEGMSVWPHRPVTLPLTTLCSTPWCWPSPTAGSCSLRPPRLSCLDTTVATCRTSAPTPPLSATTPTLSPASTSPTISSLCWSDRTCPLLDWGESVGGDPQGRKGRPSTAVNTQDAARPTPRAHTSRLTCARTQVQHPGSSALQHGCFKSCLGVEFASMFSPSRREAIPVSMGGLQLEVRPLRRADASLPQAHRPETLRVCAVSEGLLPLRPPGSAHEEARLTIPHTQTHTHNWLSRICMLTHVIQFYMLAKGYFRTRWDRTKNNFIKTEIIDILTFRVLRYPRAGFHHL